MKNIIVLPILMSARLLFAGGVSGGGPPPKTADFGFEKIMVSPDVYRRAMARLSVDGAETAIISLGERDLEVKVLRGGIVDLKETSQLIIDQ